MKVGGSRNKSMEQALYCPISISIFLTKFDIVLGGDFAIYKFPLAQARETYKIKITESQNGSTVAAKTILPSASGWQITPVDHFVKTLPAGELTLELKVHVKHKGRFLPCLRIKELLALDCSVPRPSNNYSHTENLLPTMAVYVQSKVSLFDILLEMYSYRSAREVEKENKKKMSSKDCNLISSPVQLEDVVQIDGYKVVLPRSVDIGVCLPTFTKRHLGGRKRGHLKLQGKRGGRLGREECFPTKYQDLHVLLENTKNSQVTTEVLKQFVATECN